MRIASFDPASVRNLGWTILNFNNNKISDCKAGTFVIEKKENVWQACWPIFVFVEDFLTKTKPDLVICEKTSSFAGSFITGQVSNCMGVIFACCGKLNLDIKFVYPTHVKKVVCGKGKCSKSEMQKAVIGMLGKIEIENNTSHAYDAISNIICYLIDEKNYIPKERKNK